MSSKAVNNKAIIVGILSVVIFVSAGVAIYEFLYYQFHKKYNKTIEFVR